jgi:cell division protein FtsB
MTDTLERTAPVGRKARRRGSRWASVMFVVLLVALGLVASGVLPVQQYLERETQVVDAQGRLDALKEENQRLEEEADALLTDDEIERIAREQYGYVQPGEVGYVVVPSDDAEPLSEPSAPAEPVVEPRSFLQRIWDFITGRDLTTDG